MILVNDMKNLECNILKSVARMYVLVRKSYLHFFLDVLFCALFIVVGLKKIVENGSLLFSIIACTEIVIHVLIIERRSQRLIRYSI